MAVTVDIAPMTTVHELMPRPSVADEYVRRRAAEIILPKVLRWTGTQSPDEQRETLSHLMKVARLGHDGYEMVKDLERFGWCGGADLVEILNDDWVSEAVNELTAQWVRCLNVRPQFKVGESVRARVSGRYEETGTIANVNEKLAKYGVHYSDMKNSAYYVVNFEECTAVLSGPLISQGAA